MTQTNGHIIWEGASLINEAPILLLLTGTTRPSSNVKTGWMLQTWIMPKNIHPLEAIRSNQDTSVCGSCPLKGEKGSQRVCYVNSMTLGQVYKAYQAGNYTVIKTSHRLTGRDLRMGSYGEPTAVPFSVWEPLIKLVRIHTGYTHRWKECDQHWRKFLMASVENVDLKQQANYLGWKTFRVKKPSEPVLPDETYCPAAKSAYQVTCQDCGRCNAKSGNIVVDIHGNGSRYF